MAVDIIYHTDDRMSILNGQQKSTEKPFYFFEKNIHSIEFQRVDGPFRGSLATPRPRLHLNDNLCLRTTQLKVG